MDASVKNASYYRRADINLILCMYIMQNSIFLQIVYYRCVLGSKSDAAV